MYTNSSFGSFTQPFAKSLYVQNWQKKAGGFPPVPSVMITEAGDIMVTEAGVTMITES